MTRLRPGAAVLALAAGAVSGLSAAAAFSTLARRVRRWGGRELSTAVHFSPRGGCADAVVAALAAARREVLVQAYSFTCPAIADALAAAGRRGVPVCVLLDKSNEVESYSSLGELVRNGVDVRIDGCHAIAHNKVMVIDRRTVLTGSFNFTRQADHENAENLLVLANHPGLAETYRANFMAHAAHCHAPGAGDLPMARLRADR